MRLLSIYFRHLNALAAVIIAHVPDNLRLRLLLMRNCKSLLMLHMFYACSCCQCAWQIFSAHERDDMRIRLFSMRKPQFLSFWECYCACVSYSTRALVFNAHDSFSAQAPIFKRMSLLSLSLRKLLYACAFINTHASKILGMRLFSMRIINLFCACACCLCASPRFYASQAVVMAHASNILRMRLL